MTLALSPIGKEVKITRMNTEAGLKKHLENLGFIMGQPVTPLCDHFGDLVVNVKGCRLAINKGLAMKIFVS